MWYVTVFILITSSYAIPFALTNINNQVVYSDGNGIFEYSTGQLLYRLSINCNITTVANSDNTLLIALHCYDENYLPTKDNGLWSVTDWKNTIQVFNNPDAYMLTDIIIGDGELIYLVECALGNVWYVNLQTRQSGIVVGSKIKSLHDIYSGWGADFVLNRREFNQGGHGPGIVSGVLVNQQLILASYGGGYLIICTLTNDGMAIVGVPITTANYYLYFTFGDMIIVDGTLYVATVFRVGDLGHLSSGNTVITYNLITKKSDYSTWNGGIIGSLLSVNGSILAVEFDKDGSSQIKRVMLPPH